MKLVLLDGIFVVRSHFTVGVMAENHHCTYTLGSWLVYPAQGKFEVDHNRAPGCCLQQCGTCSSLPAFSHLRSLSITRHRSDLRMFRFWTVSRCPSRCVGVGRFAAQYERVPHNWH